MSGESLDPDGPGSSEVFFMPDKKAYTKDNILIYNIFVYNIPRWVKVPDITRYFSKFGVISEVRLVDDKKKSRHSSLAVGFVNFVDPESAYTVLKKSNHRIRGSRIGVKAGNSGNQSGAEKAHSHSQVVRGSQQKKAKASNAQQKKTKASNVGPKLRLNILSLNDDCLEIICALLGLRDQIRFARVCNRFQEIFKMLSMRAYKRFECRKIIGMPLCEISDFFRLAGKNIETVSSEVPEKNRERIITFIRTCCVNLKQLKLVNSQMDRDCLKKLLRSFPLLEELNLHNCDIHDLSIESLQYLTQLESLTLSANSELTGKFMNLLVQLKVLDLYGCTNIQTSNLVEICCSMPNLKSLDIRHCDQLSPIFFDTMVEHCQQLEILKMSNPDFPYEHVTLLPRLKHIELLLHSVSHTQIFLKLVENKSQQLETLKIYGKNSIKPQEINFISQLEKLKSLYCINNQAINDNALRKLGQLEQLEELVIKHSGNITNKALIKLLRRCKHLRHLNIHYCKKITCEFVLEAINILKDRKDRSQLPLVIFVYGTSIDKYGMSECQKYMEAEKEALIKIVFEFLIDYRITGFTDNDIYDRWDTDDYTDEEDVLSDDFYPTFLPHAFPRQSVLRNRNDPDLYPAKDCHFSSIPRICTGNVYAATTTTTPLLSRSWKSLVPSMTGE
ncbi:uncharacterized protein LOC128866734 isoform X2 [Anastrepha ludens]|uniref:uncharacterized protein LOC128866734 isoform X2 n=1 Tax=Anastrepha ludens TaxID=28586 RepID=UPI0023B02060|nr:uncharacterized protein LOC128866734 isoform X2 [Anastrepha ludens]